MGEKRPLDEADLDALFEAARRTAPVPSAALMERIAADAETQMPALPERPAAPARGRVARVLAAIGGWPGFAGLATAGVAGLAIGLAAPQAVETLSAALLGSGTGYDIADLMPGYGALLEEG